MARASERRAARIGAVGGDLDKAAPSAGDHGLDGENLNLSNRPIEEELAPFVDELWYLGKNPDAAIAGMSAVQHYVQAGEAEGRAPYLGFDPRWYLTQYSEVAASGMSPLVHYVRYGRHDGRPTNPIAEEPGQPVVIDKTTVDPVDHELAPFFDEQWYINANPEVVVSGMSALQHYVQKGEAEGRAPSPEFDPQWYLAQYTEVVASGMAPLLHYVRYGRLDGRPTRSGEADFPSSPAVYDESGVLISGNGYPLPDRDSGLSHPVDFVQIFAQLGYPISQ